MYIFHFLDKTIFEVKNEKEISFKAVCITNSLYNNDNWTYNVHIKNII